MCQQRATANNNNSNNGRLPSQPNGGHRAGDQSLPDDGDETPSPRPRNCCGSRKHTQTRVAKDEDEYMRDTVVGCGQLELKDVGGGGSSTSSTCTAGDVQEVTSTGSVHSSIGGGAAGVCLLDPLSPGLLLMLWLNLNFSLLSQFNLLLSNSSVPPSFLLLILPIYYSLLCLCLSLLCDLTPLWPRVS